MAAWGPIQLRLKGSRQVEFDGEASPAPGGGSMPVQAVYSGNPANINNGAQGDLTWDSLVDGTELLDRTDPANPLFLAAGVYAVTVSYIAGGALTANGFANGIIEPTAEAGVQQDIVAPSMEATATVIAVVADLTVPLHVFVVNNDGASAQTFAISPAVIVKLA